MATIQKTSFGTYRVQLCIKGVRDSATFATQAEAKAWRAQRENELGTQAKTGIDATHTVADMFDRYAREESPKKRGCRYEQLRLALFARLSIDLNGRRIEFAKLKLPQVDQRHICSLARRALENGYPRQRQPRDEFALALFRGRAQGMEVDRGQSDQGCEPPPQPPAPPAPYQR